MQRRAQVDEVAQHRQVARRAAFGVAAVGQDLARQLALEDGQAAPAPGRAARQANARGNQALDRRDEIGAGQTGGQHPVQVLGLPGHAGEQAVAVIDGRAGGEEFVTGQPVGQAPAGDQRVPGRRAPLVVPVQPGADQLARRAPRAVAAGGTQIA